MMSRNFGDKFPSRFCTDVKRSIVTGSHTLAIKTPLQFTTLNVMGASCDLFYVSMDIYHGKFTSGKCGHTHLMQFPVVKGSFTTVNVLCVTAPNIGFRLQTQSPESEGYWPTKFLVDLFFCFRTSSEL